MATKFTLKDIHEAAEKKFGNLEIEVSDGSTVVLRNALRLGENERKDLVEIQETLDDDDADQVDVMRKIILKVSENETAGKKLLQDLGSDMTLLATVMNQYTEATQLGEASPSQD